jgi:endoglucanase
MTPAGRTRYATTAVLLAALVAGCGTSNPVTAPTPRPGPVTTRPAITTTVSPTTSVAPTTTAIIGAATTVPIVDPLVGVKFYVDPKSSAAQQEASWRAGGQAANANEMAKIASQPEGSWLTPDASQVQQNAHTLAQQAAAAGQTPLVVVYDIPDRDCAGYSAGGAADGPAYLSWLAALSRGLGHSAPVVILEPDGIPNAVVGTCLTAPQQADRLNLLAQAVTMLTAQNNAKVYLDAGNPGWVQDTAALANALRSAGIAHAAGFALNVANFYTTAASLAYGHQIAAQLGGAHFVIDTSRNGNGPAADDGTGAPHWCNPTGRALGQAPTARTNDPELDALLWVKDPGAPAAGQWWADYALQLATAS